MQRTVQELIDLLNTYPDKNEIVACPVLWDKAGAEQWWADAIGKSPTKVKFSPSDWQLIVEIFENGEDFSPDMMEEALETVWNLPKD